MDRKAIKAKAKEFAFSHKWAIWKPALVAGLIIGLVSSILSIVFRIDSQHNPTEYALLEAAVMALFAFLLVGNIYYVRKVIHGKEVSIKEDLFHFKSNYVGVFVPVLVLTIVTSLANIVSFILKAIGAGSWGGIVILIALVAEIIFTFMFVQTTYILSEDKEENFGGVTALKMSKEMMDGHKWEYFVLILSFIGWILLCIFIIPMIWVIPYIQTTQVMYYEELKKLSK